MIIYHVYQADRKNQLKIFSYSKNVFETLEIQDKETGNAGERPASGQGRAYMQEWLMKLKAGDKIPCFFVIKNSLQYAPKAKKTHTRKPLKIRNHGQSNFQNHCSRDH